MWRSDIVNLEDSGILPVEVSSESDEALPRKEDTNNYFLKVIVKK